MRKLSILLLIILFPLLTEAQENSKISNSLQRKLIANPSGKNIVWIYFTDKGDDIQKYYDNPELILTDKSINRRKKMSGKNTLDFTDLPVNNYYINLLSESGVKIKHKSKWLNAVSAFADADLIHKIINYEFISRIDLVKKFKTREITDNYEPNSNENNSPSGAHSFDYGGSFTQVNQINVPAVHDLGITGQNVTICLMDAGFNNLEHIAFSQMNIIAQWDFVNGDGNVDDEGDMGSGSHGTNTLSTIGGYAPGNLIGPAFSADFILAKTENTDSETPVEEDNWIAAMEWADSIGVDVTSTSLGYLAFDSPYTGYTWEDMDGNTAVITIGADLAAGKGIVVVNSAGNEGYDPSHNTLGAPSDGDSVIAVGAVGSNGLRTSFSSVGNTVDGRIKPDVMAMGSNVVVAASYSASDFTTSAGTSFSCPLAAGVAALILSANPNLTPMQVRDAMRNTASNASTPNREYGWGILNAYDAVLYYGGTDTEAPTAISDLHSTQTLSNSAVINWTTPSDNSIGGIIEYDIRYSAAEILNDADFQNAERIDFPGQPGTAGEAQSVSVDNLDFSTDYYFAVKSRDVWSNWSAISNVLNIHTLAAPSASVSPNQIDVTIRNGENHTENLLLANNSTENSALQFSLELINNTFPDGKISLRNLNPAVPKNESGNSKNAGQNNGASILNSGGPDNFGYKWIDSEEGGINYEWNDISSTGTEITNWTASSSFDPLDEGYAGPIAFGFDFPFYGNDESEIYFSTNGFLSFSAVDFNSYSNESIPNSDTPNGIIAAFWDDLDGGGGGKVYYQSQSDKFIVQYDNWGEYFGSGAFTYQIQLFKSGKIYFFYKNMTGDLTGATVGIENRQGNDGLNISYNSGYVHDELAVKISAEPDWLNSDTVEGIIFSGSSIPIELQFGSEDFPAGVYTMDVSITTNDPNNPEIIIPVSMTIDNVVPVELSLFTAEQKDDKITLNWITASETNNSGFEVQRKTENSEWKGIGFIEGAGTDLSEHKYSFADTPFENGNYSYRLKQIDFDGSFKFSDVIETEFYVIKEYSLSNNYPNPFNPSTIAEYQIPKKSFVTAEIYNIIGQRISTLINAEMVPGKYKLTINLKNYPSGVYLLRFSAGEFSKEIKLNLIK